MKLARSVFCMIKKHLAWSKDITIHLLILLHLCHQPISTVYINKTEWSCTVQTSVLTRMDNSQQKNGKSEANHHDDHHHLFTACSELRKVLFLALSITFLVRMKYLWNRWMDLHQIHTEDVFGSSFRWVWMSRSKVKVNTDKNGIFDPFGSLRAVYVW